jgi:hypothetical protein
MTKRICKAGGPLSQIRWAAIERSPSGIRDAVGSCGPLFGQKAMLRRIDSSIDSRGPAVFNRQQ